MRPHNIFVRFFIYNAHDTILARGEISEIQRKQKRVCFLSSQNRIDNLGKEIKDSFRIRKQNLTIKLTENYFLFHRRYFTEGLRTIENFGSYIEDLSQKLGHIHTEHEEEKKALFDVRNTLKNSPGFSKVVSLPTRDFVFRCEFFSQIFLDKHPFPPRAANCSSGAFRVT